MNPTLRLAVSGEVIAAPTLYDDAAPRRAPEAVAVAHRGAAAVAVAFVVGLGVVEELPAQAPSLPTGADETGWTAPAPPIERPVVTVFEATDERVAVPDPIVEDERHTTTIISTPPPNVWLAQSGDVLPGAVAPTATPHEAYDVLELVDPTIVEPTPTITFWTDEALPQGVAASQVEGAGSPLVLTNPVVVLDDAAPRVFDDQDVLPGVVVPAVVDPADDLSFLTGLAVAPAAPAVAAFTTGDVLPQQPVAPLGIHDEAGPAELIMVSIPRPPFTRAIGVDVEWPSGIPSIVPAGTMIMPRTGHPRILGRSDHVRILGRK